MCRSVTVHWQTVFHDISNWCRLARYFPFRRRMTEMRQDVQETRDTVKDVLLNEEKLSMLCITDDGLADSGSSTPNRAEHLREAALLLQSYERQISTLEGALKAWPYWLRWHHFIHYSSHGSLFPRKLNLRFKDVHLSCTILALLQLQVQTVSRCWQERSTTTNLANWQDAQSSLLTIWAVVLADRWATVAFESWQYWDSSNWFLCWQEKQDYLEVVREVWAMQLDAMRNRIIRIDLVVAMASFAFFLPTIPAAFFVRPPAQRLKIMICRQLDYQHERIGAINAKRPLWLDLMHAASCSCCHWHAARSQLQTQVQGTRAIPCSVCKILECKFIFIHNLPAEYSKQPIWASNWY